MDSKNFTIGILSTTAAILLVGVLIISSRPAPALAHGMTASAGSYVMTVGTLTSGDEELVFLIDAPAEKMIVYRFDIARMRIVKAAGIDLAEMRAFGSKGPPSTKKAGKKGRRGRP